MHRVIFWKHHATETRPSPNKKEKERDNCVNDITNKLTPIYNGWEPNFVP